MAECDFTSPDVDGMIRELLEGSSRAAGRLLTLIEDESKQAPEISKKIYPRVGRAARIGVTGLPGAGKSTLVDRLALEARGKGLKVGILAVDPTSPFSGGAILGDRIRMNHATQNSGVFMRSMATRGSLGGLSRATREAADVLDAMGKERIFIETVGVGQSELDVIYAVDTTVVVLVPEFGGGVQSLKAGLMEIADIFVVNKADRAGADFLLQDIQEALGFKPAFGGWEVPVLKTSAVSGEGLRELYLAIEKHRSYLLDSGLLLMKRKAQARDRILRALRKKVEESLKRAPSGDEEVEVMAALCAEGKLDPVTAAEKLFNQISFDSRKEVNDEFA